MANKPAKSKGDRQPYVDRWRAMSADEKARVADGSVDALDELAARVSAGGLDPLDVEAETDTALKELDAQVARIAGTREHLARLIALRNVELIRLALLGVRQGDLADRARVSPGAVGQAIGVTAPKGG